MIAQERARRLVEKGMRMAVAKWELGSFHFWFAEGKNEGEDGGDEEHREDGGDGQSADDDGSEAAIKFRS